MALTNIVANVVLDLYDHNLTPSTIKTIALDNSTRFVAAVLRNRGGIYDIGQNAGVTLTVLRPDKTRVQLTGETYANEEATPEGDTVTTYGAYVELTQLALAIKGNIKAQFKITSGEQELRSETFTINNGEALDAGDGDWAGDLDGHNLDEMAQSIEDLSSDVSEIQEDVGDLKEGLSDMNTATSADVGKALKAKTVTNGKVTEWEFGDTGDSEAVEELNTQMAMLIDKTPIEPEPTGGAEQVVDLTNATHLTDTTGKYYYSNLAIELPYIGFYYANPSNVNVQLFYAKPFDANGNLLTLYRNGAVNNNGISTSAQTKFELVDRRTIKTYTARGAVDWTWTTDADIAYLAGSGSSIRLTTGGSDASVKVGYTYGESSETYVEYGDSQSGDDTDTEYEYTYADALMSAVHDGLAEDYTDNEPTEGSDNFVKSGGVVSYAFKDSYNLVDPDWFNWNGASYIELKTGLRIPVTAGKNLICNCEKVSYRFYDASGSQIETVGTAIAYNPALVPDGAVTMWMQLNNGTGYIPSDHKVVIYYSEKDASPKDDRREYIPHKNLQGDKGSAEIFDYYAPTTLDKEILQMAKYSAVRNMNFCNNIIRIGTFNMYNPRTDKGWASAKKMLADYAVDVVGFQEVSAVYDRVLTEYLKGWQFTDGYTDSPVAVASHFTVLSHEVYTTTVTSRKWMRTVVQLPRYADAINPTLSIYDYHGIWEGGTAEKRAQEVAEILAVIAQDTSDFKVVVGDTNVASPSEWQTWINAGFTPVNDGNGTITTIDEYCLDNIFCGNGVTCKNWHVVPAEDYLVNISGQDLPISDHDFVFADLQFDFDSLIRT